MEIKLNIKKTQYMQFGKFKQRAKSIKLEGERLEKVKEITYLGVIIDQGVKPKKHLDSKKKSAGSAFNSLRQVGITSRYTNFDIKSFLYKVYCRPILHYGAENLTLQLKDIESLQSTESSLIKMSLELPRQVKSTKLMEAMRIETTFDRLATIKLKFYQRLYRTRITRDILETLYDIYDKTLPDSDVNSLLGDIRQILQINIYEHDNLRDIIKDKINEIKSDNIRLKMDSTCGIVDTIRSCLYPRSESKDKILKLMVKSYDSQFSESDPANIVKKKVIRKYKKKTNK